MLRHRLAKSPVLTALISVLLVWGLLFVTGHVLSASDDHDRPHCPACTWFPLHGFIAVTVPLAVYLTSHLVSTRLQPNPSALLPPTPLGRSPPLE